MRKNTGNQTIGVQLLDKSGDPVTTGNCSVVVTIDGGTQTAVGNATHEGNGTWVLGDTGAASNTNGNHTIWTFIPDAGNSTTAAVQVWPVAHSGQGYPQVDTLSIGNTTQTPRDIGAGVLLTVGTGAGEVLLSSGIVEADMATVNGNSVSDNGSGAIRAQLANSVVHGGLGATISLGGFAMLGNSTITGNTSVSGTATFGNMTITNTLAAGNITNGGTPVSTVSVADILTTQMTESYAADGTAPTIAQALFLIQQQLGDFAISGTTITVKKLDGSTTAATFTLDDATTPTSTTRTT